MSLVTTSVTPSRQHQPQYIDENGLQAFWDLDWDCFNVTRPPAV